VTSDIPLSDPAGCRAPVFAPILFVGIGAFAMGAFSATFDISQDQAISMLAAMRHASGQVVYRDFCEPHGPIAGWLFTLFEVAAPTPGWALCIASGALNAAASLLVGTLIRKEGFDPETSILGGIATAFWFVPGFGTYYHDLLAYVFVLAAWLCWRHGGSPRASAMTAATLLALAVHTKQTAGGLGVACFALSQIWTDGLSQTLQQRKVGLLALGFVIVAAGVLTVVALTGSIATYWRYAIQLPVHFASGAGSGKSLYLLVDAFRSPYNIATAYIVRNYWRLPLNYRLTLPIPLVVYASYWVTARQMVTFGYREGRRRSSLLFFLVLSSLWCASELGRNPTDITFGFGGLAAICTATLISRVWLRRTLIGLVCAYAIPVAVVMHALLIPSDKFFEMTSLRPVSVRSNPYQFDLEGVKECVRFLRGRPGAIAITDEAAFLVPLALGKAPIGPAGYVHFGLSVPEQGPPVAAFDREFIRLLEDRSVRFVVSVDRLTPAFPVHLRGSALGGRQCAGLLRSHQTLATYLSNHFRPALTVRDYRIWERTFSRQPDALSGLDAAISPLNSQVFLAPLVHR
jgi:hypothetical protein